MELVLVLCVEMIKSGPFYCAKSFKVGLFKSLCVEMLKSGPFYPIKILKCKPFLIL